MTTAVPERFSDVTDGRTTECVIYLLPFSARAKKYGIGDNISLSEG